jgi:hypothetical protein
MSRSEKISSVILVLFGVFIAYYSRTYLKLGMLIRPGAGFIPFYIGVALTVLGIVWFFHALFTRKLPSTSETGCADIPMADEPVRNLLLFRFSTHGFLKKLDISFQPSFSWLDGKRWLKQRDG